MSKHEHDLDGRLHDDCAMCDMIRDRQPAVIRERKADEAATRYAKIADRTPPLDETEPTDD